MSGHDGVQKVAEALAVLRSPATPGELAGGATAVSSMAGGFAAAKVASTGPTPALVAIASIGAVTTIGIATILLVQEPLREPIPPAADVVATDPAEEPDDSVDVVIGEPAADDVEPTTTAVDTTATSTAATTTLAPTTTVAGTAASVPPSTSVFDGFT